MGDGRSRRRQRGSLRQAVSDIPDAIGVTRKRLGDYLPILGEVLLRLTSRQREALALVVEVGYYRIPRETTFEEIAEGLDCTTSAANTLLRSAEATIGAAHLSPTCGDGREAATHDCF